MTRMMSRMYAEAVDAREAGIHFGNRIDERGFPLRWLPDVQDGNDKTQIYHTSLRFANLQLWAIFSPFLPIIPPRLSFSGVSSMR